MLKGRGRDPRTATAPLPARPHTRPAAAALLISGSSQRTPLNKPEPDYEVVEFPSDQYVNAKLQPPPPPPPRPPTGHPTQAAASCGLCGGGGARVRCSECGRQALCASCDDMYHRHPKRRNHQRQALTLTQLAVDERPPLPPKGTPPVPPPRRHKISASPKPSTPDLRRATLGHPAVTHGHPGVIRASPVPANNHVHQHPVHMQPKMATGNHLGSMPYLPTTMQHPAAAPPHAQHNVNTLGHLNAGWNRPRGSLQGFNMQHVVPGTESWENPEIVAQRPIDSWGRPLRRGASVLELGGAGAPGAGGVECGGCAAAAAWRYGSCAALDQSWHPAWPTPSPPAPFMTSPHAHLHPVQHPPQTPQSYRRADVRPSSRAVSRSGSRAVSPALSMRSRASRRTKHRTPSPPALPSSDADSESESESERGAAARSPGPGPPPAAPAAAWHCEHCTFLNEAGVRVCAVCCRTPTTAPAPANLSAQVQNMTLAPRPSSAARIDAEVSQEKNGKLKSERVSTGCGPSPPKEERISKAKTQRLETPNREQNGTERPQPSGNRHDMGVGPSPPRENLPREKFITRESRADIPHQEAAQESRVKTPTRHSVSVGPSPPRENASASKPNQKSTTPLSGQKKSTGTSPPPEVKVESPHSSRSSKTRVSNTGTSPPPQSISTQTYEDPNTWERAPSACRSRARRRLREDARRERSRSRHSLSSDTRESDRSVRTTGAWEWRERERDVSPAAAPRRRASHLDLRRLRRRDSLYGSEATSPERERWGGGGRAVSMEALAGGGREAERGLELARLLADAERLGFNAAEVQAALSQSPGAPLSWLKTRWAGLTGAVRGAAARLAQRAPSERDARAALARHRGAVWPAVTDCVDALRRQEGVAVSAERRVRGRVWGSPAGAEDEAAPGARADDSSDELEAGGPYLDEWDPPPDASDDADRWSPPPPDPPEDIPRKLRSLLARAGVAHVDEGLLRRLLSADGRPHAARRPYPTASTSAEFAHFENDFIDAYNALTRASPLPSKDTKYRDGNVANGDTLPNGGTNIEKNNKLQIPTSEVLHFAEANGIDQNHNFIPINENSIPKNPIIPDNIEKKNTNSENFQTVSVNNTTDLTNTENIEKVIQIENKPVDPVVQKNNLVYKSNIPKEQTEEKPNNLNEIVDNTQRLIQQMKDEINSDINSLDGRQSETSQSEHESSSHDEQESSYNETEGDSDQSSMTSDESRDFSEEESARVVHGPNDDNSAIISRTSSEENEEFEEALDHIDEQVKNIDEQVKNINMDILNSIAKSLQNDLTISLEKEIQESETEEADTNDNLFVAVNTFEEIYEELNTKNKPNNIQAKNNKEKPIQPKIILTKHLVTEMTFESVTPTKLMLTNKREQVLNAELDTIQIEVSEEESPNEEDTLPELTQIEEQVNADADNSATTDSATINSVTHGTESSNVINENIDIAVENNIAGDKSNQEAQSPVLENKIEIQTEPTFDTRSNEIQTEPTFDTSSNENQMETISDTSLSGISSSNDLNNRKDIKDDNNVTKVPVNTKSNIPKPVKTIQKSKDKLTPKLLVSKVPVRKTSTKQYPAPAPPKSHFGNVQNGHVKQLQNKIFNNSTNTPIVEKPAVAKDEPKPSTSAGIKNPAPRPPINKENVKQESPPKMAPKPKKNYFRETCRTEDEWTDSDSDDQSQILRPIEEKPSPTRASPPPPITLRRVSGNVIDLATVRLPEGSPERQARMLLAEGATETWEQAQLAVELISRGADPPVALLAALECADLSAALAYLHQDCELCASRFPEHEMVSMLRCTHRCCRECARLYFNVQITERSIADCVCPFCKMPELENLPEDAWLEYFAHLDILLKTLLETDVHELFQRKLRDRTLARDPNFRWCMECSSGFFVHPKHKKIRCPECRSVSCATCRKPWTPNHEGLTCEQYTAWLDDNDPERSVTAVQQHLRENGLECPRCHFKYSLSRGGCMHFTCTQCKYEFCYGCGKPFMMGARCGLSDYCAKLGLHAHHPRNCLFYLRDKEPHELQTLLQMNNVAYETEAPEGSTGRCPIQLQRETPTGLVDAVCGHEVPPKHAGLCKNHYVEYLSRAVRARALDPLAALSVEDLETLVRRAALRPPPRPYGSLEGVYRRALTQIVKEKIPLD